MEHAVLSIDVTHSEGARLVAVAGDVDLATVPELAEELGRTERCDVIVDLASVTFIDSSGLRCLVEAHKRLHGDGDRLTVRGASPLVRRIFEITGLDQLFVVEDSGGGRNAVSAPS